MSEEAKEVQNINANEKEEDGEMKKVHQFYFVKFWPYKDPEYDSKFEWARKLCQELDQEKADVIDDKMEEIRTCKEYLYSELQNQRFRSAALECALEWKTMVLDFLHAALDKSLANEGQLLTEIPAPQSNSFFSSSYLRRELNSAIEERKEKAMADAASNGRIWYPLSSKEDIEEQIRLINTIPEELRPERCELMEEIACLEDEVKAVEENENVLMEQFRGLIRRKEEVYKCILSLTNERDEADAKYYEYLSLLSNARELAKRKNVAALEELSSKQVDEFISRWNDSSAFRMSYEKAILPSLDRRQLSRDGRIRNDDEEPIILKDLLDLNGDIDAIKSFVVPFIARF
ncbi:hypothetical protein CCACVL1_14340 [Corchorus capsularis]|uniref:Proton pump-interactor 1-like protein n=1 Tax=Corchorus capsularis TaxID=210143 RepID=A0A1R3I7B3_COCAP|nr:hypothetical protein CCACVL1_14340 [Corchorus capsularis]